MLPIAISVPDPTYLTWPDLTRPDVWLSAPELPVDYAAFFL